MAAAALRSTDVGHLSPVSPELALVDAVLAAELRLHLSAPEEVVELSPEPETLFVFGAATQTSAALGDDVVNHGHEDGDAIDHSADDPLADSTPYSFPIGETEPQHRPPALFVFGAAPAVADRVEADSHASEREVEAYAVDAVEKDADSSQDENTVSYPLLPTALAKNLDATDVALREIRDRLTSQAPDKRPRSRRRFTVAAAAGTFAALAVLAVDLRFDLVQALVRLPF